MRVFSTVLLAAFMLFSLPVLAAQQAKDFSIAGSSGKVTLSDYRGKVVLLDFWASWCGPCRHSFPWMYDMQAKYKAKGLEVVAVSLDMERDSADNFLKKYPVNFTIGYDTDGFVADAYQVSVMPTSYLIDRKGNVVEVHYGFRSSDADKMEARLREVLEK